MTNSTVITYIKRNLQELETRNKNSNIQLEQLNKYINKLFNSDELSKQEKAEIIKMLTGSEKGKKTIENDYKDLININKEILIVLRYDKYDKIYKYSIRFLQAQLSVS
ncbi:MAG: hypothetical protein ACRC6E_09505, partial [Fusobacteriaceae bacterium]